MLTKTDYLAYRHCAKRLWLDTHYPHQAEPPAADVQRRMRQGQQVDAFAQRWFGAGERIPYRPKSSDMAELTQQAIVAGATTLFQATFIVDDLLIKADVLRQSADGWQLIEVKSSKSVKAEHLPDAAFQQYVLTQVGLHVSQVSVMHLNGDCRAPDLANLLTDVDVTAETTALQAEVARDVAAMWAAVAEREAPAIAIGRHCKKPDRCPFVSRCWRGIDELTIFDVPRLKGKREDALREQGVVLLRDVPVSAELTKTQRSFVDRFVQRQRTVDVAGISAEMDRLHYPIYFFDFETIDDVIPRFDGCFPRQQVPFQYSCHVLSADGTLTHRDFLHTASTDPRPALVAQLLADIGEVGSIVAYSISFEKQRLQELAAAFPEHAARLNGMVARLWDQLVIFRKHYSDYRFGTSNSLKSVLPVVVPELSYDVLDVQNGIAAQDAWERLIGMGNSAEKTQLAKQLLAYCKLDTYAMVAIHRHLLSLIEDESL